MQVVSPNGWSFEPSSFPIKIDRETDQCSQGKDINFKFQGFSVNGKASLVNHFSKIFVCNNFFFNPLRLLVMEEHLDQLV